MSSAKAKRKIKKKGHEKSSLSKGHHLISLFLVVPEEQKFALRQNPDT